jgi:hypothetical protein
VHDANEQFIDQGEPLVDNNDNGIQDANETYVDINANGRWDGPNGQWDGNTTIWTETRVLYTDIADPTVAFTTPSSYGSCPAGVSKGGSSLIDVYLPDLNLNRVQAASTSMGVAHTATKGSVQWVSTTIQDGYGFQMDRLRFDAAGAANAECAPTSPVCVWKVIFGTWGQGYLGQVRITGAAVSDATACQNDVTTTDVTVLGVKSSVATPGAIQ